MRAHQSLCVAELPDEPDGLRIGTPEVVRWGMTPEDMPQVARFIADVLTGKRSAQFVAPEVASFRSPFARLHFIRA